MAPPGGERLRAAVGADRLARSRRKILFDVPPSAFDAAAQGDLVGGATHSAPDPLPCGPPALERVTEAAFGQRRKMLRQSLKSLGTDPPPLLAASRHRADRAGQEHPRRGFAALARNYRRLRAVKPQTGSMLLRCRTQDQPNKAADAFVPSLRP